MNSNNLDRGIAALKWEFRYRKMGTDESVAPYFLVAGNDIDADFTTFLDKHDIKGGDLLDVGTGTGELAIAMAKRGFNVTATDISPTAISTAKQRAKASQSTLNFIIDDLLDTQLKGTYDVITDRGCFTLLHASNKACYLEVVAKLLRPGGLLLLKMEKRKSSGVLFTNSISLEIVESSTSNYTRLDGKSLNAEFLAMRKA